ncbi:MAG: DUF423 domain-containing protein [Planctomycetota bacterium]
MRNPTLALAGVNAFLAVAAGAWAAHGLEKLVPDPARIAQFETGARYHMYHALALLSLAGMVDLRKARTSMRIAGCCFLAGILLFSGSLYLLVLTGVTRLGMITPIGGLAFLAGWLTLALAGFGKGRKCQGAKGPRKRQEED